ncbi:MAG: HAMP domain-containing histidine kinase, partial [Desulfovibrionales bacterium]|nr:HAMP domain-containing histidine kinase [Desulfovibrionales bacterium]
GDKQLLVFPIQLWGKQGRFMLVHTPLWPSLQILMDFLVPTAGTGLLIGLIVIPLILRMLRPLKDLEQTVMTFATGDLSQRATPVHNDEIGKLSRTFNMMADNMEQMTRLRHELTANISHELRSPLTRIQMSEELARMSCKGENFEKVLKHLDAINAEVEEMDGLVEEILKFSRLELNAQVGEIGACDVADSIAHLIHKNNPIIERKKLIIHENYSHDCVITCNYPMVNLALSNLISNALKFSSQDGTISISTLSSTRTIIISIFNTYYRTLSKDELVSIFEPFARAEGENIPGTGLGLALVAKVVEQHGGTIGAENRKDGILFRLTLPRSSSPAPHIANSQNTSQERDAC